MDPRRFDRLTQSLSGRADRRSMFKLGGAGLAATLLGSLGLGHASARQAGGTPFTVIRTYKLSGTYDQVTEAINSGYLPSLQQESGYLGYSLVTISESEITTIATFASEADYENASADEGDWVAQNLAQYLPAPATVSKGNAVIWTVNTDDVCGDGPEPTEAPPTEEPTEAPCTGSGCPCNGGVEGTCDDGLVCCQTNNMGTGNGGGAVPGGPGTCATPDACPDGATPVS